MRGHSETPPIAVEVLSKDHMKEGFGTLNLVTVAQKTRPSYEALQMRTYMSLPASGFGGVLRAPF